MGTTEIQQALLDATQLLSQKNVKEANYAVTIKCTIKAIVDAGLNLYTVEYGGNQFNVYGDSNISYKINDIVYVLVPDNNFNQEKHIIGAVAPRATMLVDEEVNSDVYVPLSGNLFTRIADVNLKSWKDTTSLVDIDTNNFSMVFSDYLDTYRNFLFTARIKTNIDKNHQMSGNYGLILNLPFIQTSESGTTTKIWQSYAMDVNTMQGNPYAFNEFNKIDLYYEIDDSLTYDASREPYITSFVSGFGYTEDRTGIDYDIFIKDISVEMIDVLSESEKDGYYLVLTATGGNYFLRGKFDTSKVITPTLKIKGKTTNDFSSWDCYWFVEDTSIDTSSEGYLSVGGLGWKCLNKKTNIAYDSNGKQSYQYVTNNYALPITNEDIISSLRYKCVFIQDEIVVGASIQIKNLNSNIILHLVSATGSNFFVENIGEVRLKARIYYPGVTDGSSNITLSTAWQRFDKSDTYIDNNFYTLIKDNDPVVITDATGNSKTYFETEISYPCSKLEKLNTVNCTFYSTTVKNGNTIKSNLGTVSIIVGTASNFTYGLTIDGGDVLYKYDSDGDSPLVANYDGPLSSKIKTISPISFRVYKADGTELTETEYLYCQYRWSFPKNSMMTLTGYNLNSLSQDDDYYYITGYGKNSINYTILSTFNKRRNNNTIILSASFSGNELSNSVTPKFLKEGESGTNGTKYSGIITYQDYGYGERDNNNKIRKLQLVYIAGTGWRLYDVVNQSLVAFGSPQLKVQVYADGSLITSGYSVVWEMFDNASSGSSLGTTNITCFNIGRTNGIISAARNWDTVGDIYTNIVRATVTITAGSDASSREILYIYYPIEITRLNRTLSKIPSLIGGFDEVVYGSDGTNPEYDNTNPFECVDNLYNNTTGYYTYVWAKSGNLQGTVRNSYQQKFTPVSKFDNGISKNYVKVTLTLSDSERGKINNLISSLTTQRNNATNLVNFYTADKKNLLDFVAKFEYNSYINQLNECKQLLLLRGQAIQIIDNMYPILEQINTYCIYNKINPLDFDYQRYYVSCGNSLDNARSSLYDLLNTGTLSYLNSLVSAEIVINENIKSKYNISVFNQLKNFIASWSEQLNKYISYYTELTKQINRVYVYQESLNKLQTISSNLIALSNNSQIIALTTAHNGNNAEQKYINLKNQIAALVNKISSAEGGLNTYAILVNNLLKPINELLKVYKNTTYQTNYYNSLIKKYSDIVTSCNNQIAGYQAALLPAATDAIVHIKPIIMVYNRYELSHLNGWDGNKLYLDSNNNEYLFMPQMGAGAKDSNNTFTGIVMGVKKFNNNTSNQQIGLFGYSSGSQSIFLNAKNGSATFGVSGKGQVIIDPSSNNAIIKSGNYSTTNKTGMQIDLTTPEIRFGSGNFVVNSSGHVTAKGGGSIAGWIINDTSLKSSNSAITLDSSGNGKIYSNSHNSLNSKNNGFYLSSDGLSIGNGFAVTTSGVATVTQEGSNLGQWKINANNQLYSNSNGILLDAANSKIILGNGNSGEIYSGKHTTINSVENGFYLSGKSVGGGLSIGNKVYINYDGLMRLGAGAVDNKNAKHWTISGVINSSDPNQSYSYISYGTKGNNNSVYIATNELTIGSQFYVDANTGLMRLGRGAVNNTQGTRHWTINSNDDLNQSYIAYNTNLSYISTNEQGIVSISQNAGNNQIYIGTNGIRLGKKFAVDDQGNSYLDGTIVAREGKIGGDNGFTIESKKMYSGNKNVLIPSDETISGVYIGTDGISLGPRKNYGDNDHPDYHCRFEVNDSGELYGMNVHMSGTIYATSGYFENIGGNEWYIDKDGKLHADAIYVDGEEEGNAIEGIYNALGDMEQTHIYIDEMLKWLTNCNIVTHDTFLIDLGIPIEYPDKPTPPWEQSES